MKKISIIVIVALFVLTMSAAAGDFQFVGGPTISKIDLDFTIKANVGREMIDSSILIERPEIYNEVEIAIDNKQGASGFYGGVRYKFDNGFILGAGYETQSFDMGLGLDLNLPETEFIERSASSEEPEIDDHIYLNNRLSGPYLEVLYELSNIFALRGAIISNSLSSKLDYDLNDIFECVGSADIDAAEGSGIGYQVGAEVNYPITDNLSIVSSASYITGDIDIEKVYDCDGEKLVDLKDIDELFGKDISDLDMSVDYSGYKFAFGINYSY